MNYQSQHIASLIYRLSIGVATETEKRAIEEWAELSPQNRRFVDQVTDGETVNDWLLQEEKDKQTGLEQQLLQRILSNISVLQEENRVPVVRRSTWKTGWLKYAAILLLMAGGAAYWFGENKSDVNTNVAQKAVKDAVIVPGGNKAVLTLSDGSTILLDSAGKGTLAKQGSVTVVKLSDGKLAYQGSARSQEVLYNTITTPPGGIYQVTLSDNTKVWLNASSSIRFPTSFTNDRSVTVTGEVYMEVEAHPLHPFLVKAGNNLVTVLGTSFNINAYHDEPAMQTTLLTGKLKISASQNEVMLSPGLAARVTEQGDIKTQSVDTNRVIAWKNGWFNFEDASILQIMNQLKRWYNIEVRYEGIIPVQHYSGGIERELPLQEVLDMLRKSNVHFKMENRVITVLP